MKFVKYEKLEDFMKENFGILLEKEWLNCLIVGNCLDKSIDEDGILLAKVMQNSVAQLIILYRKPWKLLMYSPTGNASDELYKFAAEQIYKLDKALLGVNAEKEIANKFAKYYSELAQKQCKLVTPMRILVLEKILPMQNVNEVNFRKATIEDKEQLTRYIKKFNEEALNKKMTEEEIDKKFKAYIERGYYVLERQGKIVSQAVIGRELLKGKSISCVYTPKEERGNGLAYNLVYKLTEKCLNEGAEYCVLYTDADNPISNHVYEKIGYEKRVECEDIEFI